MITCYLRSQSRSPEASAPRARHSIRYGNHHSRKTIPVGTGKSTILALLCYRGVIKGMMYQGNESWLGIGSRMLYRGLCFCALPGVESERAIRGMQAAPAMASSGHCVCGVRAPTPQASRNLRLESVGLWRTALLLAGTASRSGISCAWLLSNQKPCSQYIITIK